MVQSKRNSAQIVPVIGRNRETAFIQHQLTTIMTGQSKVVLLSGEAGIGKTRLLDWARAKAVQQEIVTLRGGASDAEGMPPYLLLLEALGPYILATAPDVLHDTVGVHAAVLGEIFPEMVRRLGETPLRFPLPSEQARLRLYEAVSAFLSAIAAPRGLLLILDDLQWADRASLELLSYVVRHQASARILILGALREGGEEHNPALGKTVHELNRLRVLTIRTIAPLAQNEVAALAADFLGAPLDNEMLQLLVTHSEGSPFFTEELLRGWLEADMINLSNGYWQLTAPRVPTLPASIVSAIRQRLERLSPTIREYLRTAALIGRSFDVSLLAHVLGYDVEKLEEQLQEAVHFRLIHANTAATYSFKHDKIRECLYEEVINSRRRRLHGVIGQVLESRQEALDGQRLAELAFHFTHSGDLERGVVYAQRAAETALRAYAPEAAAGHYRTALELLSASDTRRSNLWMGLGEAATLSGDYVHALEAYQNAQETWLRTGDKLEAAQAWFRLGQVYWRQEAVTEAKSAFEHALELFDVTDSPDAAQTLLQLADLHAISFGHNAEGIAYAERALAMVQRLGNQHLEASVYRVMGNIQARSNMLILGQESLERALGLAQSLDDPALSAEACASLANIYAWTGEIHQSREISLLRAQMAERTHDLFHLRHVYSWIALQEILQGRWEEAEASLIKQEKILDGFQSPEPRAAVRLYRTMLFYYLGRFSEAEQDIRAVVGELRPTRSPTLIWYLGWWGQLMTELGQFEEALRCFIELEVLADDMDEQARSRGNAFGQLAVGYARLGEQQRAVNCYHKLLPFRGQFTPILINRGLALAAVTGGDKDAALRHFLDAESQARQAKMYPELALTLVQRGILEREVDPSMTENEPLIEGLHLCDELGMQTLGQRMLHWRVSEIGRSHRVVYLHPAGLSIREIEVIRLVAQGMTNREIAEALVLSEKTVARHLTNIFNKTGVENRAGAAAYALRNGLA
jgi:tetratricopeptide (TPR) repeat protein/DNA-binding CsgD family transcriptional regulator